MKKNLKPRKKQKKIFQKGKVASKHKKDSFLAAKKKVKSEEKKIKKKKVHLGLRIAKSNLIASKKAGEKLKSLGKKLQTKRSPIIEKVTSLNNQLKKLRKKEKNLNMKKAYLKNAMEKVRINIKNMQSKISDLKKRVAEAK